MCSVFTIASGCDRFLPLSCTEHADGDISRPHDSSDSALITPISLQGILTDPDGSPAQGTVCATPTSMLANGSQLVDTTPQAGILNMAGQIVAQSLYALVIGANDDAGTTPPDGAYVFTIQRDGSPLLEFTAAVPAASTATDVGGTTTNLSPVIILGSLIASLAMQGQPITGTNIPSSTTVLSVDENENTLTLSNPCTGSDLLGCTFVVGGAIEMSALIPDAL